MPVETFLKPFGFSKGVLRYHEARPSRSVPRLWYGLYAGKVTLLNGETGAGKSSLLRLIALHAALDEPLFGESFGMGRPLKVLYIDPENMGDAERGEGGLTVARMDTLCEKLGKSRPPTLTLHSGIGADGQFLDLSEPTHMSEMKTFILSEEINLLILDPYANLFNAMQENDNGEALRRVRAIKRLADETECAVLICHHTGKAGEDNGYSNAKFGRGASALLGGVDVGLTFRLRNSRSESTEHEESPTGERRDLVMLKIEKNRVGFDHKQIYLRMAGKGLFDVTDKKEYLRAGDGNVREVKRESQEAKARSIILEIVKDYDEHDRSELIGAVKATRISEKNAMTSLVQLVEDGELLERRSGHNKRVYRLRNGNPHVFEAKATKEGLVVTGNWTPKPKALTEG